MTFIKYVYVYASIYDNSQTEMKQIKVIDVLS